jgi:Spy/CpxP family protein refolding chaperone
VNFKAILIAATLVVGSAAFAQAGSKAGQGKTGTGKVGGPPASPGRGPGGGQFQRRTPEERVERLAKSINLNADQKKKVLAIYKANAAKGKTIFEDKKMTQDQKRAAFEKMRDESNTKMKAILTKDQIKKMDEMRKQMRAGGPGRGPGGPGTPPPPTKSGGKGKGG